MPEGDKIWIWRDEDKVWFNNIYVTASFQKAVCEDYPLKPETKMIDVSSARKVLTEEQLKRSSLSTMVSADMIEIYDIAEYNWQESVAYIERI